VLADGLRLLEAGVARVVVDGLLDRLAGQQPAHMLLEQVVVERVGMVEVAQVAIGDRDVVEVPVIRVWSTIVTRLEPRSRTIVRATSVFPEPDPPAIPIRMFFRDMAADANRRP
jgi:hypothetical protein